MNDRGGGFPRHCVIGAVHVGSREGSVAVRVNLVDPRSVVSDLAVLLARTAVQRWWLDDEGRRIVGWKESMMGEKKMGVES